MRPNIWFRLGLAALGLPGVVLASPAELDIHGAMAQAMVVTSGNEAFGDSNDGSSEFYEVALNARTQLAPQWLVAGQVTAREAGDTDTGELRLDFLQLDYQFWSGLQGQGGLRIGRVKNPLGLFNDSRDVVFTRPGIVLPSVYLEHEGFRDIFFFSDGVQAYGFHDGGIVQSSVIAGWSIERDVSDEFSRLAGDDPAFAGEFELPKYNNASWQGDWLAGRLRTGLSWADARIEFTPAIAAIPGIALDATVWVGSVQWFGEQWLLTAEYSLLQTDIAGAGQDSKNTGDSFYLQYERDLRPDWSGFLRYDLSFSDRNDRDGRRASAETGEPRHTQFARTHVAGLQWTPNRNWGIFAEYHYVDGTQTVQDQGDDEPAERYWSMALLMLAYQF